MKTATATDVKNRFGDYLGEALKSHEPLFIEKHGKTVAVLVEVKAWLQREAPDATKSKTPWCDELRAFLKKSRRSKRTGSGRRATSLELLKQIRNENS